jgi:carbon-monoxide dehydrogenase medium subunit
MIPAAFDYEVADSVAHAVQLLGSNDDAKLLAGGHSLLPLLKLRVVRPSLLVDVGRLTELSYIRNDGETITIGALTRHHDLATDALAREHAPLLSAAATQIGDPQVRHRGTIGGSVSHGDPASDLPAVLLALDAEIVARSKRGEHVYGADGFFTGAFTTALADDELVTEIRLPGPRDDAGSAYAAMSQKASGYSIVGVAAVVIKEGGSAITKAAIALTGVGEAPYRARAVETALVGNEGTAESIAAAAAHATDGVTVNGDIHADSEYRTAMAAVYTRRAIAAALGRLAG